MGGSGGLAMERALRCCVCMDKYSLAPKSSYTVTEELFGAKEYLNYITFYFIYTFNTKENML